MSQFTLKRTVDPVDRPITLEQVKSQLELPQSLTDRNDQLYLLIDAATDIFEQWTRRALLPQTWLFETHYPVREVELPRSPFTSIVSVDSKENLEDAWATVDYATDCTIESDRSPAKISWTGANVRPNYIKVVYTAGYADQPSIPTKYKLTLLQLVSFYYYNRGDYAAVLPIALRAMLDNQRCGTVAGFWSY